MTHTTPRAVHRSALVVALVLAAVAGAHGQGTQTIPTPERFFGFPLGAERKLAPLDKIYEYFALIDKASDRVVVQEYGKTTMGKPMILAIVSAPETIASLAKYQAMQKKLADPRTTSAEEAEGIARESKGIVMIETAQHSPEVTSHLMAIKLIHKLATESSPWLDHVLKNTIVIMIPVGNPDGHQMVVDWHTKNDGTPYQDSPLPELWHKYIGHDNNRDNYMQTQVETQNFNRLLLTWLPDVYVNVHNMGADNARIFIPPYKNPANPNIDPVIWTELGVYGNAMAAKLHDAGKRGVVWGERFEGYREGSNMRAPLWRNAIGILTETAGVPWGTTIDQAVADPEGPSQSEVRMATLAPERVGRADGPARTVDAPTDLQPRMNYPTPWLGGKWTLAEAADYQFLSTIGLIEAVAYNHEVRKRNFYLINTRTIELYAKGSPYAYLVPPDQRDPVAAARLVQLIQAGGAEIHRADAPFTADGKSYPAGTHVALLAQPFGRWVKNLLEPQEYPDIRWPFPNSPIDPPYDVAAWSLGMLMGVRTVVVDKPFDGKLTPLREDVTAPAGKVTGNGPTYVLPHEVNNSFVAMNRLLKEGAEVSWARDELRVNGKTYAPGAVLVGRAKSATLAKIAQELKLNIDSTSQASADALKIRAPRIAVYEPWGGNMDAGWVRWLLEQHEFIYTHARNADLQKPDLLQRFDVIILGENTPPQIVRGMQAANVRPEYKGGIGPEGVANLRAFVKEGGTVITLGNAAQFAIEQLGVPFANVVQGLGEDSFFCPGSILRIAVDTRHPIGYGMPEEADAMFVYNGGYVPTSPFASAPAAVVARYPHVPLLRSGWIVGDGRLRGTAAVMETAIGKGRVITHTFRVQFRGQSWGTFKLLFNSIFYGPAMAGKPAVETSEAEAARR